MRNFDPRTWSDEPITTMIGCETVTDSADGFADTVDAFAQSNGKIRLGTPLVVDKVINHLSSFQPPKEDLRTAVRRIEDQLLGASSELAAILVANQALDFHKQDGFTEIEEANQALLVERALNDALLADEAAGKVVISRAPAFVGAVSNFSHFLDLCRKMLRNLELGVPIVLLSRSNTTQHMFRYFRLLVERLAAEGIEPKMATYLATSIEEQRRVLASCPESPMYFTGSRAIAERIREVAPRLCASTGGPNTMLAEKLTGGVVEAAQMSHLIEHKGQCTAMRHLVVPNASAGDVEKIYAKGSDSLVSDAAQAIENGCFASLFRDRHLQGSSPQGYQEAPGALSAFARFRVGKELPTSINEMWREAYLDITAPPCIDDAFLKSLAGWCNKEQPISLAINCTDLSLAMKLFERTSLVVYTIGHPDGEGRNPALTCQARPQDGEVFGEVPPRRALGRTSRFPVIVPTSTPGYNSCYSLAYLRAQGEAKPDTWGLPGQLASATKIAARVKNVEQRGFCREILTYLIDAAKGPRPGVGRRSTLFGLQRPPLEGGLTCLRLEKPTSGANLPHQDALFDDLAPLLLPFVATNARSQLVVSLDPFLSFPAFPMLQQAGIRVLREKRPAFEQAEPVYWNVIVLPGEVGSREERPLAAHFVSRLLCFGHVKSSSEGDDAFLEQFSRSDKWLRCPGAPDSKL